VKAETGFYFKKRGGANLLMHQKTAWHLPYTAMQQ